MIEEAFLALLQPCCFFLAEGNSPLENIHLTLFLGSFVLLCLLNVLNVFTGHQFQAKLKWRVSWFKTDKLLSSNIQGPLNGIVGILQGPRKCEWSNVLG